MWIAAVVKPTIFEVLLWEQTAKLVNRALVFLWERCVCDRFEQNMVPFFSLEFFDAFHLRGLRPRDEHQVVYATTLIVDGLLFTDAQEPHYRNTVCVKHPWRERLQFENTELKSVFEPRGAEQLLNKEKQVTVHRIRRRNGYHSSWIMRQSDRQWTSKSKSKKKRAWKKSSEKKGGGEDWVND